MWVLQGTWFDVPHSVDLLSAAIKLSQFCPYILAKITPKERRISKKVILTIRSMMIGQQIDVVAGDFNGTACRCSNRDNISTIDRAFANCALPTPPGPTALWGPGTIPNYLADVCGFLKPPDSDRYWKVRMHGALHSTKNSRPASNRSKLAS